MFSGIGSMLVMSQPTQLNILISNNSVGQFPGGRKLNLPPKSAVAVVCSTLTHSSPEENGPLCLLRACSVVNAGTEMVEDLGEGCCWLCKDRGYEQGQ